MQREATLTQRAAVTVVTPTIPPANFRLDGDLVSIGRAPECTIPIKDRYLSRHHADFIPTARGWTLRDCGSANGTYVNGSRVEGEVVLRSGDRIRAGDTEILFETEHATDRLLAIADAKVTPTISIAATELTEPGLESGSKGIERLRILNALAAELLEERPLDDLFGFISDRVMEHLQPSRVAIGLLDHDGKSFRSVEVRRRDSADESELAISRTLLDEVVQKKRALAFMDVMMDEKLSRAKSIVLQGIHSVLCAPLLVHNAVLGVLYVDFLFNQRTISEEDVRLVAQIARFAAIKLENTRLREESIQKRLMDEELKMAYVIQRRLLPSSPPPIEGYTLYGLNRPCRTVSGDYYDFVARPDGRTYFVIADVSGKGVTAALLMAGLQASFRIFTKNDPSPADLLGLLNTSLKENFPQSRFVTIFAGRLDPSTGDVEYANAGHTPPLWVRSDSVDELAETDLILGMFTRAEYRNRHLQIAPGDALVLFTDGVTEAGGEQSDEAAAAKIRERLAGCRGGEAKAIAESIEQLVVESAGEENLADDVTLLVITRTA